MLQIRVALGKVLEPVLSVGVERNLDFHDAVVLDHSRATHWPRCTDEVHPEHLGDVVVEPAENQNPDVHRRCVVDRVVRVVIHTTALLDNLQLAVGQSGAGAERKGQNQC